MESPNTRFLEVQRLSDRWYWAILAFTAFVTIQVTFFVELSPNRWSVGDTVGVFLMVAVLVAIGMFFYRTPWWAPEVFVLVAIVTVVSTLPVRSPGWGFSVALEVVFAGTALVFASWFLRALQLRTEVNDERLQLTLTPLWDGSVDLDEVESTSRRIHPWTRGIQWRPDHTIYMLAGRDAVELTLDDGRRITLGSQRPEELEEVIGALSY